MLSSRGTCTLCALCKLSRLRLSDHSSMPFQNHARLDVLRPDVRAPGLACYDVQLLSTLHDHGSASRVIRASGALPPKGSITTRQSYQTYSGILIASQFPPSSHDHKVTSFLLITKSNDVHALSCPHKHFRQPSLGRPSRA